MAKIWPKMTKKWPKMTKKWPKMAKKWPKMTLNGSKWPKMAQKWSKMAQKWHLWNVAIYAFCKAQTVCCQAPKTILHPWAGPCSRSKPVPGDGFCLGRATLKDLPLCLNGLLGGTYGWGRGLLNLEFQQETVVALLIWHSLSESICFICCNSDLMTIMQNNKLRHISWLYCVRPFNSDIFRYWTYHTKGLLIR